LSDEERARASRFVFDRDREQYRAAHILARRALSACDPGVQPAQWVFISSPHGRPEVAAPQTDTRLRFNISHAAGLVGCIVAADVDCGIDVEGIDRAIDIESLAGIALTPEEIETIRAMPEAARAESFFRRWTLKEAYAKARGLGVGIPFQELAVELGPPIRIVADDDGWQLASWSVGTHWAAIALRHGAGPPLDVILHDGPPGH
jgi:4'-phosphopantetheinyl transferase